MQHATTLQLASQQAYQFACVFVPGAFIVTLFYLLLTSERAMRRERLLRQAGQEQINRLQDELHTVYAQRARTVVLLRQAQSQRQVQTQATPETVGAAPATRLACAAMMDLAYLRRLRAQKPWGGRGGHC